MNGLNCAQRMAKSSIGFGKTTFESLYRVAIGERFGVWL